MLKRLCVLALPLATAACSGNSAPTAPTQASITLTVLPNPVTATVCSPPCVAANGNSYQFRATGTLTVQETAGLASNIDSITSGILSYTSAEITQRSGTSRVAAKGTLIFPLGNLYGLATMPNASRSVVFPITVELTDDRGNHLSSVTQWAAN